jgi:hypothetical protein
MRMTSTLFGLFGSGVIHQVTAHHLGRERNEVSPAASLGRSLPEDLYVNFVDQGRRLKCMVRPLSPKLVGGHTAKIAIQQIKKPALGGSVAAENSLQ